MNFLIVPAESDALIVTEERAVRQPAANFSHLPYRTPEAYVNPENAFLSENVVAQPFNDVNLWLLPGVHLSWTLPASLTQAVSDGSGAAQFPQLPNRWLVVRTDSDGEATGWVIESDYVWPESQGSATSNITVPWSPDSKLGETHPYRYAGRAVPVGEWQEDATAQRLSSLIAPGYGVQDFLAAYPNSFSLFGLYDSTVGNLQTGLNGSTYQVLGWYSDLAVDPVALWAAGQGGGDLVAGLEQAFGWTLIGSDTTTVPQALLVYTKLALNTTKGLGPSTPSLNGLELWAGNAASEALAAFLASGIDSTYAGILEEQLDALQLGCIASASGMEDTAFPAALHRQGFSSRSAGVTWQLVATDGSSVTPPNALGDELAAVDSMQRRYNKAADEIAGWRERIFADWYKYMVSKFPPDLSQQDYPDPDEIEFFMSRQDFVPLNELTASTGEIQVTVDPVSLNFISAMGSGAATALGPLLAAALTELSTNAGTAWKLRRREAAPYLAPAEPVLLFSGDATETIGSEPASGATDVPCQVEVLSLSAPTVGSEAEPFLTAVRDSLDEIITTAATYYWTRQPWRPIAMEWQVELLPFADDGKDPIAAGGLSPAYITENFTFGTGPDLVLNSNAIVITGDGAVYSGRCLLSEHGPAALIATLVRYIAQNVLPPYFLAESIPPDQQADFDLIANLAQVTAWFVEEYGIGNMTPAQQAANVEYTALRGLAAALDTTALTQRISGFNASLRMFRQTLQMPVEDPLSLPAGAAFSARAAGYIAGRNREAPVPLNIFLPIRTGAMDILRLRLVDRFGQVLEIPSPNCRTAMTLSNPELEPGQIYLAPRLTQSSRLAVDWLDDASHAIVDGNEHAVSPICGWILPNYLDETLLLYEADGKPLGALSPDPAQVWQPSPAAPQKTSVRSVRNQHLRALASAMISCQEQYPEGDTSFFGSLMDVMEQNAPLNVSGPGAQTSSLPLMMGRPLAVVRLRLQWTVDGLLSIDQSWNAFREDLEADIRDAWGVEQVKIPITLGDVTMPANGVIGYWIGSENDVFDPLFYAPLYPSSATAPPCPLVQVPAAGQTLSVPVSLADGPVTLTLLIDPRAPLFVRSGLAPEVSLQLSPAVFSAAMSSLAVTFLSGPIVMPQDSLQLTLPKVAGAKWRWYSSDTGLAQPELLASFRTDAVFNGRRVVREGWTNLKLGDDIEPGVGQTSHIMDGAK